MNALDLIILGGMAVAAYGGYRLGFLARVVSWIGLGFGVWLAVAALPDVLDSLAAAARATRFVVSLSFVVGVSVMGQALGLALSSLLNTRLSLGERARRGDQVAGAVAGVFGVLVAVWLLLPALADRPGWSAREARSSAIVRSIDRVAPAPPQALQRLAREVAADGPEVLGRLTPPPASGPPPTTGLAPDVDARVRASTVRVEGTVCHADQFGSGFVVRPGVVVTNAHVVAGELRTFVTTPDDVRLRARVVAFDPRRDLALLLVQDLFAPPLELADARPGALGAVYGHPGGGALTASPARVAQEITAVGTDIYRSATTRRDVFVLAATLAPGDSGGALVDRQGRVIGVAFAIDPGRADTAYALTNAELRPEVDAFGPSAAVDTGPCVAD